MVNGSECAHQACIRVGLALSWDSESNISNSFFKKKKKKNAHREFVNNDLPLVIVLSYCNLWNTSF